MNTGTKNRNWPSVWDVALGALLHDIGKLKQRASGGKKIPEKTMKRASDVLPSFNGKSGYWHALWSDSFFDWVEDEALGWPRDIDASWVRDLAVYHHNPLQDYNSKRPELVTSWITTIADRAASGYERKTKDIEQEEDDSIRRTFRQIPMDAIQTRVKLSKREHAKLGKFLPKVLTPDAIIPQCELLGADVEKCYQSVWQEFENGWKDICKRTKNDPREFEAGILSLMERTAWAVPSSTMDQPDVSLYDHSRAVSAFAACIYKFHKHRGELGEADKIKDLKKKKMRFLVGDLSGLQRTLFRLKNEQIKGLNKILRGRSFRFQLVAEIAIKQILEEFGLPLSCALQNAGGRFLILLPELKDTIRKTDELRSHFDEWLANQYMGDLGLGLALSDPFAVGDLCPYPADGEQDRRVEKERAAKRANGVRANLRIAIETAKLKQLQAPAAMASFEIDYKNGACSACGVRPASNDEDRCLSCSHEHDLGGKFPKARAVIFQSKKGNYDILGERIILPVGESKTQDNNGLGWRFDEGNGPAPIRQNKPYVAVYSGDDIERHKTLEDHNDIKIGDIKTFASLALESKENVDGKTIGREMLVALKADVDNLGLVFGGGLGGEWSIARQAALSRLIDGYFTMRLPELVKNRAPNTYTVYAGGDDLFLVGPWQEMLDFAMVLRKDFAKFSNNNPSLTISMGLALFDAKTPISIAADEAEHRLEAAKEYGRNKISVIEKEPMSYDEYEKAIQAGEQLNKWLRSGELSTAALYRFLSFDDARARISASNGRGADYSWMARFGYHLARMLPKRKNDDLEKEIAKHLCNLFGFDENVKKAGEEITGARLAISHALYRNR